jgi:phosphate butyryltransferase
MLKPAKAWNYKPPVHFTEPMNEVEFKTFHDLLEAAARLPPLKTAVVDATARHVIEGASLAAQRGFLDPLLIGDKTAIEELSEQIPTARGLPVHHASSEQEAAHEGVRLVKSGVAHALMKGDLHTDVFLNPILNQLRTGKRVSHVFMMEMARYPKLLYITDAAVNIAPDLKTKAEILHNAVGMAHLLGITEPRAAVLSAIEVINPAIPCTIDAACLSKMADRGQFPGALVDGPLAFDNAISAESAAIKGIRSPVSGEVDLVLVPDLVSGNILAKTLEYLAGAALAGVVLGAVVPIILTSRADPPSAHVASAAVSSVLYHRQPQRHVRRMV